MSAHLLDTVNGSIAVQALKSRNAMFFLMVIQLWGYHQPNIVFFLHFNGLYSYGLIINHARAFLHLLMYIIFISLAGGFNPSEKY